MAVATLKVGKKMVEVDLDKAELDSHYETYTFKRRHTKKLDLNKREAALATSKRVKIKMATVERNVIT